MDVIAGMISSAIFATSNFPMVVKAYRTRDLRSYSLSYILMNNVGNVIHWLYISKLPFGPIWLLHTFYTIAACLMLILYLRYEGKAQS